MKTTENLHYSSLQYSIQFKIWLISSVLNNVQYASMCVRTLPLINGTNSTKPALQLLHSTDSQKIDASCFLLSFKHTQRIYGTTRTPSIERLRNAVWFNQRNSQMTGDILNLNCSAIILLRHISHSLYCFDSRAAEHKQKIRIWSDGALLSSLYTSSLIL